MIEREFTVDALFSFSPPDPNTLPITDNTSRTGFKTIGPTFVNLDFRDPKSNASKTVSAQWLPWISGAITETALYVRDVFSGPFSGCWMVAYQDSLMRYVGHIGTGEVADENRTVKRAWHDWAARNGASLLTGFNPFRAARDQSYPQARGNEVLLPKFFGLFTQSFAGFVIICYTQQPATEPPLFRIADCIRVAGVLPPNLKDIFSNDPEIFGRDFPFTLTEWKNGTGGGAFHTRSPQLKTLDAALATYLNQSTPQNQQILRDAFETWKREKPGEYHNPTRDKRMCISLLETYLSYHK